MVDVRTTALRRRQIDRALETGTPGDALVRPREGWIAAARTLIGMRAAQVASRLGISTSAVLQFERSEVEGAITLTSLEKVADALGCRLVYGFVPRAGSFEQMVGERAEVVASRMVGDVGRSMALEDQATSSSEQQELIQELAQDLIRRLPRSLWDEAV